MTEPEITVERLGYLRLLAIRDPQDAFFALGDGEFEALIAMAERGMEAERAHDFVDTFGLFLRGKDGQMTRFSTVVDAYCRATEEAANEPEEQPHG